MNRRILTYLGILLLGLVFLPDAMAQGERKAIIFTGVVVDGTSAERLPNATIMIPRAGKGTIASDIGYFAIPVFPGDSVVFSYTGYKTQYHIIPKKLNDESYSAVVAMRESINMLDPVVIYPYSTEEEFKKAFLELQLPDQADQEAIAKSMDPDYINRMSAFVGNNAQTNYRHTMNQYMFGRESMANRGFASTMPFLNPFAWASFIKSVKKGDLKQKEEWRKELGATPKENLSRKDLRNDR